MHIGSQRANGPATSSLCPWRTLPHSGVVASKRGLLLAGYYAAPPDAASSTPEEREQTSHALNQGLLNFGTGTAMWTDVAVVPAASYPAASRSHFPDPVSRMIEDERRQQFSAQDAHYENERVIVVAYQSPAALANNLGKIMYRGNGMAVGPQAAAEATFARMLDRFESAAGRALRLRRMASYDVADPYTGEPMQRDELVNYLYYCLSGRPAQINLPKAGMSLPGLLAADFTPGHTPVVNNEFVCCVTIDGFPGESFPGITDALTVLGIPYRFTQRWIPFDEVDAQKVLEDKRKFWRQRMSPFFATIFGLGGGAPDQDAVDMHSACVTSLALSKGNLVKHGYYNGTIILRHRDLGVLNEMREAAERAIYASGFVPRTETDNAPDAFLGTLPGNITNNVRRPMLHTFNLADLAPSSGIWTGRTVNPNPLYPPNSPPLMHAKTVGSTPFRFNVHVGDNGNFAFFGPPGSGKTTLLNATCLQFLRYPRAAIRSIDYKRGMKAACLAAGGSYYELGGEGGPAFYPFQHLETPRDRLMAQEWVEAVFQLQHNRPPSSHQSTDVIHHLLEMLATARDRSITHAILLCHDEEVSEALRYYSWDGPAGSLFDGEDSGEAGTETHWDAFDVTDLMAAGDKLLLPSLMCLEARFDRIQDGRPILETIDESWAALSHPLWRPRLRRRWKTKRSKNVAIGIATQNLADMPPELLSLVLENIPSLVFGANPAAEQGADGDEKGPAEFYANFGLNARQRQIIAQLQRAREYYAVSPEGSRAVDFGFGPLMLAFAGTTSEEEVGRVTALREEHGDDWIAPFLASKGIKHGPRLAR